MRKIVFALALITFIGGTAISVNAQNKDIKSTSNQQDSKEVEKFRAEVNDKISKNEKDIAELKEKMSKEKEEVKMKYEKKIAQVEQKNKELKRKMANYKNDGNDSNWKTFKTELNHDMDELGKAIKDLTVNNVK